MQDHCMVDHLNHPVNHAYTPTHVAIDDSVKQLN